MTCNPGNERIKRSYFRHLTEAEGLADKTVDHARRAINGYEEFSDWCDFKRFTSKDAVAYKKRLLTGPGRRSVEVNDRSTVHSKLLHLEKFFVWLSGQPGFRKAFTVADARYFKLPRRERNVAMHRQLKSSPSLEQMQSVIRQMPGTTDVELRNRALMACLLLTGVRVGALRSLKLRHVLPNSSGINQDARDVDTKGAKTFRTFFFPVGDDIRAIFLSYVEHLRVTLGWGEDDPLFPSTRQDVGDDHQFSVVGLERKHWKTADPVRAIFHAAFSAARLPRYTPHSVRRTLVLLGQRICRTPEQLKAWSQNLGHEQVLTSFTSYGALAELRQAEIMAGFGALSSELDDPLIRLIGKAFEAQISKLRPRGGEDGGAPCLS